MSAIVLVLLLLEFRFLGLHTDVLVVLLAGVWFLWWVLTEIWVSECLAVLHRYIWLHEVRFGMSPGCGEGSRQPNQMHVCWALVCDGKEQYIRRYSCFQVCWKHFCLWFLCSLTAVIDCKVFCVHGGLSPAITTLDQVSMALPKASSATHSLEHCCSVLSIPSALSVLQASVSSSMVVSILISWKCWVSYGWRWCHWLCCRLRAVSACCISCWILWGLAAGNWTEDCYSVYYIYNYSVATSVLVYIWYIAQG